MRNGSIPNSSNVLTVFRLLSQRWKINHYFPRIEKLAKRFEEVTIHSSLSPRTRCIQLCSLSAVPRGAHRSGREGEADGVDIDYLLITPAGALLLRRASYQRILVYKGKNPEVLVGVIHEPESVSFTPLAQDDLARRFQDSRVREKVVRTAKQLRSRLSALQIHIEQLEALL